MIKQGTYNDLIMLRDDIERNTLSSPSYAFFFSEKIRTFFAKNAMDLKLAKEKTWSLLKKYCELDADGQPIQIVEEGKEETWRFINDEAAKQFDQEFTEFLKRGIKIHC